MRPPNLCFVMELCDRASVMKNGKLVGTVNVADVTDDDLLGMIILLLRMVILLLGIVIGI